MRELTVVCPSRGRPRQAQALFDSFMATRATTDVHLHFALDSGDETVSQYPPGWHTYPSHSAVEALNEAEKQVKGWEDNPFNVVYVRNLSLSD